MSNDTATIETADWSKLPADPLVSVYMLAYRHEKFIAQAIEGVIAQQCDFPIELIIGEDCSPDRTRAIAQDYQRRYPQLIRVLTSEKNVGAQANSARCRRACRGEFISICEGDDFWHHPRKLQMQVDLLRANGSMQLVHTDYDRIIGDRLCRSYNNAYPPSALAVGNAYVSLLRSVSIATATSMYRREGFMAIDGTDLISTSWQFGDYPRTLFAAVHGPVGYIPVSTATYRHVMGSATNTGRSKWLALKIEVLDCRTRFMAAFPLPAEIASQFEVEFRLELMWAAALTPDRRVFLAVLNWLRTNHVKPPILKHLLASAFFRFKPLLYLYRSAMNTLAILHRQLFWERYRAPQRNMDY
jgi:glycosyltransferase involved in cell wall biosynthesis